MDDKESFMTIWYKQGYIHTCWNRTTGKEEIKTVTYEKGYGLTTEHKTFQGAQRHITKVHKEKV